MTIIDVYMGSFVGSLLLVGLLGWVLFWPSQR